MSSSVYSQYPRKSRTSASSSAFIFFPFPSIHSGLQSSRMLIGSHPLSSNSFRRRMNRTFGSCRTSSHLTIEIILGGLTSFVEGFSGRTCSSSLSPNSVRSSGDLDQPASPSERRTYPIHHFHHPTSPLLRYSKRRTVRSPRPSSGRRIDGSSRGPLVGLRSRPRWRLEPTAPFVPSLR